MTAQVLKFIPAKEQGKEQVLKCIAEAIDDGDTVIAITAGKNMLGLAYSNINLERDIDRVIALLEKTKYQLLADWAEGEL